MNFNWIVVQTKSNNEIKASVNLMQQGFEVFYPKVLKTVKVFNRLKKIIKPLFPGYIFVNLDKNKKWFKINNTFGVNKIIRFGEKITFLPVDFVESLKQKCDNESIFDQEQKLKPGDKIKVIEDPFFNIEGIFLEKIDTNRIIILLDLLKTSIRTTINKENIEIID